MDSKLVNLESTYNFRDFGGYHGKDHKKVKMGRLYRADSLSKLTDEDVDKLVSLNIRTIIDYRSDEERYNNEDVPVPNAVVHILDPIASIAQFAGSGTGGEEISLESLTEEKVTGYLAEQNLKFVESVRGRNVYSSMLRLLLETEEGASVQHCTAGKDRTGYGVALVLMLLGVSREDIIKDYLQTNVNLEKKPTALTSLDEEDEALIKAMKLFEGVKESYISGALDLIENKYGGAENYVIQELGFSEEEVNRFQEMYLE